jgi:hypothetical protein
MQKALGKKGKETWVGKRRWEGNSRWEGNIKLESKDLMEVVVS